MATVRMSQIHDLATELGHEPEICEIGHLDQYLADLAAIRPLEPVGGAYTGPAPTAIALAQVPVDQRYALEALLNWNPYRPL